MNRFRKLIPVFTTLILFAAIAWSLLRLLTFAPITAFEADDIGTTRVFFIGWLVVSLIVGGFMIRRDKHNK